MVKRVCRDCPVPNCGAKYLVRLANHLADVHLLDIGQRRRYLQEAKLQPKVKFVVYQNTTDNNNTNIDTPVQQEKIYELSQPRRCDVGKVTRTKVRQSKGKDVTAKDEKLKHWLTID